MEKLTGRQKEILQEIERLMEAEGYPPSIRELAGRFDMAPPSMLAHVKALERKGAIRRRSGKSRGMELVKSSGTGKPVEVPILGRVAAGPPILAEENLEGTVLLDPSLVKGKKLFALRIQGDSMIEAGLFENDLCIVRMTPTAENGEIVVVLLDGEATVKRFREKGKTVQLIPANPKYPPITITPKGPEFRILGKVIALYRSL
jgi:repressor LexA